MLDTASYYVGSHQLKTGFDFSTINNKDEALPLHFGGRYIFAAALPGALLGLPFPVINAIQAVALGIPAAYVQGYGNPTNSYRVSDLSLFVQDDWRLALELHAEARPAVSESVLARRPSTPSAGSSRTRSRSDSNNLAPRVSFSWDPTGDKRTIIHGAYGIFFDNHITALSGITNLINGDRPGAHARRATPEPAAARGVERAGTAAAGNGGGRVPEPGDPDRSRTRDAVRAPRFVRRRSGTAWGAWRCRPTSCTRAGYDQLGHDRLQPDRAGARRRPASGRRRRTRGHVGVDPAIHVVRRNLVPRPDAVAEQALQRSLPVSRRATRSRRPKTTRPISRARSFPRTMGRAATGRT